MRIHVRVHEQKQDGSVEELDHEDSVRDQLSLACLGILADVHAERNNDESKAVVDDNDEVGNCSREQSALILVLHPHSANRIRSQCVASRINSGVLCLVEIVALSHVLLSAEALERPD